MICTANEISKVIGGNSIFTDISFQIGKKEKVGIVGRNGSGKTTLFQLISGKEQPDQGQLYFQKGIKVGYLSQIPTVAPEMTVRDVLSEAFVEIREIEKRMKKLENAMTQTTDERELEIVLKQYGAIQEEFSERGGYEIETKLMTVANGLNIAPLLDIQFDQLSGGEQTKVGLGITLLMECDLLLLDEPTNHLDIFAVEWLEQFLQSFSGTVMVISHDRYFLDKVVTKILDIEDGKLEGYHGNYTMFTKQKEEKLLAEFAEYKEQQKKIKKMKQAIKRLREWANRSNPPSDGLHRRASNMEKALERMEKLDRPQLERKKIDLEFSMQERSGKDVITCNRVSKSYENKQLFRDVSFSVRFQDRIAIVGPNGCGKSTLLKLILEETETDDGTIQTGSNVNIGYLSQKLDQVHTEDTVLSYFREGVAVSEGEARSRLAKFLFYGHAVFKKVKGLSGGERIRLKLAQFMSQNINLLLLDEPTNHLDIDSREVLEDALLEFEGTVLGVSHDRYFLNKCFQTIFLVEQESITSFQGNFEDLKSSHYYD